MVIDPKDAAVFIAGYKDLLIEVHRLADGKPDLKLLDTLNAAREAAVANPAVIDVAVANLEAAGRPLNEDVLEAIRSLKLRRWIFLRDTTKYSIFIEPNGKDAFAVLGLTQRPRDIAGGVGVLLHTGVVYYRSKYVCDGIVAGPVWLGANYRREYSELFASLKKSGHFHSR